MSCSVTYLRQSMLGLRIHAAWLPSSSSKEKSRPGNESLCFGLFAKYIRLLYLHAALSHREALILRTSMLRNSHKIISFGMFWWLGRQDATYV